MDPIEDQLSVAGEASSTIVSTTRSTEATALVVRGAHLVDLTMLNKSVQRESHPCPQLNYSPFTATIGNMSSLWRTNLMLALSPLTGNNPYMAVSNDCVALCDNNAPLSNLVEGNNPDSQIISLLIQRARWNLTRRAKTSPRGGKSVESVTAVPAELKRGSS